MRALRVVGVSGDGAVVLEDPGRRERYTVPADEQLRAAARGDVTRLGQIAIELESQLRPREIQARIRGGASVEQVASAAGVPVQKIERFAYPVLLERSRTAELAQGAHPQRTDGPDVRTLGETVAHTFGLRGQDYTEADWDSWRGEDGKWVVALSWQAGRSDNTAHWAFQPGAHGGTVVALDEHASDLVEGLPARPLRPLGPVIDIARDEEQEPAPEPESPHVRAAAAGEARAASGDLRPRGIAPEQRRSSPPPSQGTRQREADEQPAEPARGASAYAGSVSRPAEHPVQERPSRSAAAPVTERADGPAATAAPAVAAPPVETAVASTPVEASPSAAGRPDAAPGTDQPAAGTVTDGESGNGGTGPSGDPVPDSTGPGDAVTEDAVSASALSEGTDSGSAVSEDTASEVAASGDDVPGDDVPGDAGPDDTGADTGPAAKPAAGGSRPAARSRTKKGKPVMPSWDEVLLGVRGQR